MSKQQQQSAQMDWGSFGAKLELPASNFVSTNPATNQNPCIRMYGFYEKNPKTEVKCKTCTNLLAVKLANTYYKCGLRKITGGPATDHRVRWQACGKYEPRDEETAKPTLATEKRGVKIVRKPKGGKGD